MSCFSPLQAYQSKFLKKNGKAEILFKIPNDRFRYNEIQLPCGQCIGCRLERSRQWAIRCVHEASLYDDNCFITLTYDDDHIPLDRSLNVRDFQLFMKRLRKSYKGVTPVVNKDGVTEYPIRFYHCGEYGEKYLRPHYHAIIFNFDFTDKYLWKIDNGYRLYRSPRLEELWPYGHSSIGNVTFESAAYVARYIMKKKFGKSAWIHYADIDWHTGEVTGQRKPEYTTMSRRPGIAYKWFEKYRDDVFPRDFVVMNGQKIKPPKYYDSLFEISYPSDFINIKNSRINQAKKFADNNTPERLSVREQVSQARLQLLIRDLD